MPSYDPSSELDLRDYLRVLRRRRWVIALVALAAVAGALVASFVQSSVYEASAKLVLKNDSSDVLTGTTAVQFDDDRVVQTELQIVGSASVKQRVRHLIGVAPSVQVNPLGQTNAFEIVSTAGAPADAARVANTYGQAYIDVKRQNAVSDLKNAGQQILGKINGLDRKIASYNSLVASAVDPATVERTVGPQRDAAVTQESAFRQQYDRLQVQEKLETGGAQISAPAEAPGSPSSPKPVRNAVLAFAVGLILGLGTALLFEYFDDTIKTKDDLDAALGGLPTLGLIPAVSSWKSREDAFVVTLAEPTSMSAEAYRSLRTSVQFLEFGQPTTVVEVTSPNAAEGKTTTLVNLAVGLAQAGQRVCIVCCDLRRPRVHSFFDLSNEVGFTSVLTGEFSLSTALQDVADVPGLSLLASGPLPPNPSELLSSQRAEEVLTALRARFDTVLLDSPPVLPVTDAAVLVPLVDATLVVVNAGSTSRRACVRALELLRQVHAPVVGGVLNGMTSSTSGYGYGYGYGTPYSSYQSTSEEAPADNPALLSPPTR